MREPQRADRACVASEGHAPEKYFQWREGRDSNPVIRADRVALPFDPLSWGYQVPRDFRPQLIDLVHGFA
jgi:hypothetical protein